MKNLFKISTTFQLRNKMTLYNIIFLTTMTLLMIFLFTYKETIKNYLDVDIYNSTFTKFFANKITEDNHTWTTKELDNMQQEIKEIPHVKFMTYQYAFGTTFQIPEFTNSTLNGYITGYAASNDTLPEIVKGTNFPDDNGNYLICPENFYPTSVYLDKNKLTKEDKVNIDAYLNKKITLDFDTFKGVHQNTEFELIGLYKNDKNNFDEDVCYINRSSMIEIGKKLYEGDIDEVSGENTINEQTQIFVQIDSFENTEFVKKELQNLGYVVDDAFYFDATNLNKITKKLDIFIGMSIICIIIIEILLFNNFKIENENNFNLLYVLGYKKKNILFTYIFSNLIQIITSLIISLILLLLALIIIHIILSIHPFIFSKYRICLNFSSALIIIGITIFSSLINYFTIRKKINGEFCETKVDDF